MRVSVISPHMHNTGGSTLSMLLALELASTGKKTCITHISPISSCFYKYLNFIGFQDKTSTPNQIVRILKTGGLSKDDVSDYCKQVADNLEAFTNESSSFTKEDMEFMVGYISTSFPHEHIIYDVDSRDLEQMKNVINCSDVIVLNITQSVYELNRFNENKEAYTSLMEGKPVIVVVNKYNSVKGTLKEVANWMGIKKPNNWLVLHENPWIAWSTNHGQLNKLHKKIINKDDRVIELKPELTKICSAMMRANKDKKPGRR